MTKEEAMRGLSKDQKEYAELVLRMLAVSDWIHGHPKLKKYLRSEMKGRVTVATGDTAITTVLG